MKHPLLAGLALSLVLISCTPSAETVAELEQDPRIRAAHAMLIGTWQSEEDSDVSVTFNDDATMIDAHTGASVTETKGTWSLFTSDTPDGVDFQLNNNDVYLAELLNDEKYHYRIAAITPDHLELVYMERGTFLRFAKISADQ